MNSGKKLLLCVMGSVLALPAAATQAKPSAARPSAKSSSKSPTGVAAAKYDGTWKGITAEGKEISFVVERGKVVSFQATGRFYGGACPSESSVQAGLSVPLVRGSFEAARAGDPGTPSFTAKGKLDLAAQPAIARGELSMNLQPKPGAKDCAWQVQTSWVASRTETGPTSAPGSKPPDYDGIWTGLTARGEKILFKVRDNKVVFLQLRISFPAKPCFQVATLEKNFEAKPDTTVAGGLMVYESRGIPSVPENLVFSGSLLPEGTASGQIDSVRIRKDEYGRRLPGPECTMQASTVWKARKDPTAVDPTRAYDGIWKGLTGQDKEISFTIVESEVREFAVGGKFEGPGCTSESNAQMRLRQPHESFFAGFIWRSAGEISFQHLLANFELNASPPKAKGAIEMKFRQGACSGSAVTGWIATRQPAP